MTVTSAKVIADSLSPSGVRLTTIEVTFHRFVLAEFNTHRVLSRNSASSRAIPATKMLDRYRNDPAYPIYWGSEQPGMQSGEELTGEDLEDAMDLFDYVRASTADAVAAYLEEHPGKRLHKSVLNRLLEPFLWHTVIVTATEWDNFMNLRCHQLAQPEIRVAAELMREAMAFSVPEQFSQHDWHLPYVDEDLTIIDSQMMSVARCAWVSTMSHDGEHDLDACKRMYDRLVEAVPMHASPLEHQARPMLTGEEQVGNLVGWRQLRHLVEDYEPRQTLQQFFDDNYPRTPRLDREADGSINVIESLRKDREGDTQPMPIPSDAPIAHLMVQDDLEARLAIGIERYGQPLQPFNGRDSLQDAYEEALDLVVYLKTAIYERDHP